MDLKISPRTWLTPGRAWGKRPVPPIDFQMHTTWTDGHATVPQMLAAARAKQLKAIAVTEHVNESSDWYPQFADQVKELRSGLDDLDVYYGAEIAVRDYDGNLKVDPRALDTELVLGVVHRLPKETGGFWEFERLTAEQALDLELRALLGLARNSNVDVIGHPGGTTYRKFGSFPVDKLEPVLRAARDNGVAIELNTRYMWDLPGFLDLLRAVDPLVSFGSDAHYAEDLGLNYDTLCAYFETWK